MAISHDKYLEAQRIIREFERQSIQHKYIHILEKYKGVKLYLDMGMSCYYECYMHSVHDCKYLGHSFVFVKNKEQLDTTYSEAAGSTGVIMSKIEEERESYYKKKQKFMEKLCNE